MAKSVKLQGFIISEYTSYELDLKTLKIKAVDNDI